MMVLVPEPQYFYLASSTVAVLPENEFCALRSFLQDRRGIVALEFAIVLPILLLIFIGGLHLALAVLVEQQLIFITQSAAVCAAQKSPNCLSEQATDAWAAQRAVALPGMSAGNFTATFGAPCGGVEVVVTYSYSSFGLPSIPLAAEACYPVESPTTSWIHPFYTPSYHRPATRIAARERLNTG
jgi:hypothetical protein